MTTAENLSATDPSAIPWQALVDAATSARSRAYAPYSGFRVGAALYTGDGDTITGCNVENRSYGLCICAERTAVVKAVEGGRMELRALVVVSGISPPALPCGMCRETLNEFAPDDLPILVANPEGERMRYTLRELHPAPFTWSGPGSAAGDSD
ncbi:MAG: cytidine deaminase [Holophagales bacterium]|nr:cytidine deaminase [Holophagales bacterium]